MPRSTCLLRVAGRCIAACDSSKIGHTAFARICALSHVELLVTDAGADPEQRESLEALGLKVLVAGSVMEPSSSMPSSSKPSSSKPSSSISRSPREHEAVAGVIPYEADIAAQPEALRAFAASSLPGDLGGVRLDVFERIVLTGMGASHIAAHPAWRSLVVEGRPAWWVTTTQLLEAIELVTPKTLLWVTSQSGESAEVVSLLGRLAGELRPAAILGTTNDPTSTLARAADVTLPLHCGDEATVSTKSYVTTLASHARTLAALHGDDDGELVAEVLAAAADLESFNPSAGDLARRALDETALDETALEGRALEGRALDGPVPRFAFVGARAQVPSALAGALLLKEAAKLPAEGYVGGEFRHGPLEIAGAGLTAVLFGDGTPNGSLEALSRDLVRTGATVATIDPGPEGGTVDRFESGPRGDRFESGGRGDRFESGGRGDRFESGGRGDRFESGPRGDRFESGPRGDRFESGARAAPFRVRSAWRPFRVRCARRPFRVWCARRARTARLLGQVQPVAQRRPRSGARHRTGCVPLRPEDHISSLRAWPGMKLVAEGLQDTQGIQDFGSLPLVVESQQDLAEPGREK